MGVTRRVMSTNLGGQHFLISAYQEVMRELLRTSQGGPKKSYTIYTSNFVAPLWG
jgi:hypothetical protein